MREFRKEEIDLLKIAIFSYGTDSQMNVAIEEMSELIKEICKWKRGLGDYDHIVEELADVYIMLRQLELIYEVGEEDISREVGYKLSRLNMRLADNDDR